MISHLVMKYIVPEQRSEAEKLDMNFEKITYQPCECLNCPRDFYVLQKFEKVEVSCPHCENKLNIRCYKNGRVQITRIFK